MRIERGESTLATERERRRIDWGVIGTWIFWLAIAGGGVWWATHHFVRQTRERHAAVIQEQQQQMTIRALVLSHHAFTNWAAALPDRGGGQPFSVDVVRVLIRSNQQPVLVECDLRDVAEQDGRIIATFSSSEPGAPLLTLKLQCGAEKPEALAKAREFSLFAVFARCRDVQRLSGDDEGFLVTGELVDLVRINE